MAARIVSAVSGECSHLLSRTELLTGRLNLRHSSCISRFRARNVYYPVSQCISSVHSANCVQAKVNLWDEYNRVKSLVEAKPLPKDRDPLAVYANNELKLGDIDVYGFDYDYTVACYNDDLNQLIYDLGRANLMKYNKYPSEIEQPKYDYDPSFAVRGLHCDVERGILLKIDSFHNIQMGTAYRGLQQISDEEVVKSYGGRHVGIENISGFYGIGQKMYQLVDRFALPEMTLYANVIQFFKDHDITYCPEHVFYDVRKSVQRVHLNGDIYQSIVNDLDKYLARPAEIVDLLRRLAAAGKKLFLITNSTAEFVDKGMTHLVGAEWYDMFDVVITRSRKPKFFTEASRPFRKYNLKQGGKSWDIVNRLDKGCIYQEGNITHLMNLTGWASDRVLYIGDHVYMDLADVTLKLGWRTGAIITELEDEIKIVNSVEYKKAVTWYYALESLISAMQVHQDAESQQILDTWRNERQQLKKAKKDLFNVRFGSPFRSHHNPTYFTRRLSRFADIYTSSLVNFLKYPLNYTFYPQRTALPHEPSTYDLDFKLT